MHINKHIEKQSNVFGLPLSEFFLVLGYVAVLLAIYNTCVSFSVRPGLLYLLFGVFSTWGLFLLLKWGANKNYPGFIMSFICYKVKQPKKIFAQNFKIDIIN